MSTSFTTTFDYIRVGDALPAFAASLLLNGSPFDLTGNTGVVLKWKNMSTGAAGQGTATVVNVTGGQVSYQWQSTDTTTAGSGTYTVEWVVTLPSGVISFPDSATPQTFTITKF